MAECHSRPNGERYVYYFSEQPDPPDTDRIETGGEETESGEEDRVASDSKTEEWISRLRVNHGT